MSKKTTKKSDNATRRQFLGIGGAAAATLAIGAVANTKGQTTTTTDDCLTGACATSVAKMATDGRAVQVIGRVSGGKVIFDQASLDEFAKTYPNAEMCFVAVNAPFDPVKQVNI
jgi:hypothetical protein